jgi:hypothetical protein
VETSATDARDSWLRASDRYDRLAQSNAFFLPIASVVRELASRSCAVAAAARVDGVDLHLVRAMQVAVEGVPPPAIEVRLRALTDGAIEIRCVENAPRARPRVRVVMAEEAADSVEHCLWEIGWIAEAEWRDDR